MKKSFFDVFQVQAERFRLSQAVKRFSGRAAG